MKRLVGIYNADAGFGRGLLDSAHKAISPSTYQCDLCALTHGFFGAKQHWQQFLEAVQVPFTFLHRNDDLADYQLSADDLPVIMYGSENDWRILVHKQDWNQFADLEALIRFLWAAMAEATDDHGMHPNTNASEA